MSAKAPVTPAVRFLRQKKVAYAERLYDYVEHGGTAESARQLGVDEHCVVKTLVIEDDGRKPLIVLMHGDRSVSLKNLARQLGAKAMKLCEPDVAKKHTGYLFGGTSPFGTLKPLPVYYEKTILELPIMLINCGKRGFLVEMAPADVVRILDAKPVEVGIAD